MTDIVRIHQTRLASHPLFDYLGSEMGTRRRRLFAMAASGVDIKSKARNDIARTFAVNHRWLDALVADVDGTIKAVRESAKRRIDTLNQTIASVERKLKKLAKRKAGAKTAKTFNAIDNEIHQRKRRLEILNHHLAEAQIQASEAVPSICFGSRKLFNAQHHLEANGYVDHVTWKTDWTDARSNSFGANGKAGDRCGNGNIQATLAGDGTVTLRIRPPEFARDRFSDDVVIAGIKFPYEHDLVCALIARANDKASGGLALTWRFIRDAKGWRITMAATESYLETIGDITNGVIAIDFNFGFLAVTETDGRGNPVASWTVPMATHGLTSGEAKAVIGNAVAELTRIGVAKRKPVAIEKLDFAKKKAATKAECTPKRARMLSGLAYSAFGAMMVSATTRAGLRLITVNPAYTSFIGRCRFMDRYGLSVHHSAALAIGRRAQNFSERELSPGTVPTGLGFHVTLSSPARMDRRHVWRRHGEAQGRYKAAVQRHFKATARTRRSAEARKVGHKPINPVSARREEAMALVELELRALVEGGGSPPANRCQSGMGNVSCSSMSKNDHV